MDFLKFDPSVFVIGEEYELLIITEECGIISLSIGGENYYEENTGVLSSEKNKVKIRVPKKLLDEAGEYTVVFRKTIDRKAYFSKIAEPVLKKYSFKGTPEKNEMKIYHISDVHTLFESATRAGRYFGDECDLYIVNGDTGEVESVEDYENVARFLSSLARGEAPILFVRGNHDTRGKLAELYTDYFPANNKDTFYTFRHGFIHGIAFDLGEDKPDACPEYTYPKPDVFGGVNVFSLFREKEDRFFASLTERAADEVMLAVGHIPPAFSTSKPGTVFDIERERYDAWSAELERVGVDLMLSGHYHDVFVLESDDKRNLSPHSYPIVIGSKPDRECFIGAAIRLTREGAAVAFTDSNGKTVGEYSCRFARDNG